MNIQWCAWLLGAAALAGCSTVPLPGDSVPIAANPWAAQSADPKAPTDAAGATGGNWQHYKLPGKTPSQFSYTRKDGRDAMAVMAVSSASMLRHKVRVEPQDLGSVRFSWKVPELIAQADMALRDADDSPVRIILSFDGDRSKFSARNSMLSELARTLTGEELPYATLMYVWCNKREPGSVIHSPRTDRIRKLVVETGPSKLNQWLDYERNIKADFERAFGEAPGALVYVAIMTDSDNTHSVTRAWYGPVRLGPQVVSGK
ncbi:MAG: DUF3047 domain-containing protein [Burkholderiales bacterium]|nr:DUF3047 domain-containing protein [Burkholderiales bacterium]